MRHTKIKQFILLLGFILPATWCGAYYTTSMDGPSPIQIMTIQTQGEPKTSSIQASINGHWLSVVFLENLGQVTVEVSSTTVGEVETESTPTPNGVNIYIPATGSYIVTFTLANGDIYYGEFEVED